MAKARKNSSFDIARILVAAFGIFSAILVFSCWQPYREEIELSNVAHHILLSESFNPDQLSELKLEIDRAMSNRTSALALDSIAVIRLRLFEQEAKSADRLADLKTAITSALSTDPNNAFLWLAKYWLQDSAVRVSKYGVGLLNMSYLLGPNEAWIAVKRNPLAASVFSSLSSELSEKVATEFVGLVRSGYYSDAIKSLVASQEPVRQQMLGRLAEVDRADRLELRKTLRMSNLDWLVPGIVEPAVRPF